MGDKINPDNRCSHLYKELEYNPKALDIMMEMQLALQVMYGEKRGTITPNSIVLIEDQIIGIREAIYYFTCFAVEYHELCEKHNELHFIKKTEEGRFELEFEVIDMWHFLMNIFLYSGIKKFKYNLEFYYGDEKDKQISYEQEKNESKWWWELICRDYGQYIDQLPYKSWKTYKDPKINIDALEYRAEMLLRNFFGFVRVFGINKEKFYSLYVAKNKENLDRQNRGY